MYRIDMGGFEGLTDVGAGLISAGIGMAGNLAMTGIAAGVGVRESRRERKQEQRLLKMQQEHAEKIQKMMLDAQTAQMQVPQVPSYANVPQPGAIPGNASLQEQMRIAGAAQGAARGAVYPPMYQPLETPAEGRKKKMLMWLGIGFGATVVIGGVVYFVRSRRGT